MRTLTCVGVVLMLDLPPLCYALTPGKVYINNVIN